MENIAICLAIRHYYASLKNRRVSNREFDFKKDIYKDDGHHITRELKSVNKWTKKEIDRRQKKFSKKIIRIT